MASTCSTTPARSSKRFLKPIEIKKLAAVLWESGSQKTLRGRPKQYVFWNDLPMQIESSRPPQCHQTINFVVRDPDLRQKGTVALLTFRQVQGKNPHAYVQRPGRILPPDWVKYYVNGHEIKAGQIRRAKQPPQKIPSGFKLYTHEQIRVRVPGAALKMGANTLSFHVPRFPHASDPYIYMYELTVDVCPR